jgi:hypothetical protein
LFLISPPCFLTDILKATWIQRERYLIP